MFNPPLTALYITPVIVLVTLLAHFLPSWTRPDLFFAVTVDPAFRRTPEATRILRQYRFTIWIGAAASAGLAAITGVAELSVLPVLGFLIAQACAHRQTLTHAAAPSTVLEVNLAAPPETFPGGLLITLPPFAALAALALWAKSHWEQFPAKIPVHWGIHGVDRFVDRTTTSLYGLVAIHAAICLSFFLMAWGILHWSRRVSTSGASADNERLLRRLNVQMMILLAYYSAAQAWISLSRPGVLSPWAGLALAAVLLIALCGVCVWIALLIRTVREGAPAGDRTPDSCWKLGLFYINPSDPSVFVAKRLGIGYTLNFGNRWSWAVMGVLLVAVFARAVLK